MLSFVSDIPDFQTSMTDHLTCNFRHNLLNQCKWSFFQSSLDTINVLE